MSASPHPPSTPRNLLGEILRLIIRPEFRDWQVVRHDGAKESFDPLRLLQSFLESGIDLESSVTLFDSVVHKIETIHRADHITQDRIYDVVVDALMAQEGRRAQVWLANYTSIFGVEHEAIRSSREQVNVRQKGELKKRILTYLCERCGVESEEQGRALLGDDEFSILTDQLNKIVRYCGFYTVKKEFLETLFEELSERSVKSILPSTSVDKEVAIASLHKIEKDIILAREESRANKTVGFNILSTAVEKMASILLAHFGVISRRNTMGSLRQFCDLVGTVGNFSGARIRSFPNLDKIKVKLKDALAMHRRPLQRFWEVCDELRSSIEQQHVLLASKLAEDILASAKLIIHPDATFANIIGYRYPEQPVSLYIEFVHQALKDRGFNASYSSGAQFIDVECDNSLHPILDYGRILRLRPLFSSNAWDKDAFWATTCMDDAKDFEGLIPVVVSNQKLTQSLVETLQRQMKELTRSMAVIERPDLEAALYKPESIKDLVLGALIPTGSREDGRSRLRIGESIPRAIVGYERSALTECYTAIESDKGSWACRDCCVLLESAVREYALFLYGLLSSGAPRELTRLGWNVAAGKVGGKRFWGMGMYLSWIREVYDLIQTESPLKSRYSPLLLDRPALADLTTLSEKRNSYAHRSREIESSEARHFLDLATRALGGLNDARKSYIRGLLIGGASPQIYTDTKVLAASPKDMRLSALEHDSARTVVYVRAGSEEGSFVHIFGQCERCMKVALIESVDVKGQYECGDPSCKHRNHVDGVWQPILRRPTRQTGATIAKVSIPASKTMPRVFISYASEDKEIAEALDNCLRTLGFRIWRYETKVLPGGSLTEQLGLGLKKSQFGALLVSESYLKKSWAKAELNYLLNRLIDSGVGRIIPILIDVSQERMAEFAPLMRDIVSIKYTSAEAASSRIKAITERTADV